MCDKNQILNDIEGILLRYQDRDAIIHYKLNKEPQVLTYRDVEDFSRKIQDKFKETIQDCLVGLYMNHNVLIPSIILWYVTLIKQFCLLR